MLFRRFQTTQSSRGVKKKGHKAFIQQIKKEIDQCSVNIILYRSQSNLPTDFDPCLEWEKVNDATLEARGHLKAVLDSEILELENNFRQMDNAASSAFRSRMFSDLREGVKKQEQAVLVAATFLDSQTNNPDKKMLPSVGVGSLPALSEGVGIKTGGAVDAHSTDIGPFMVPLDAKLSKVERKEKEKEKEKAIVQEANKDDTLTKTQIQAAKGEGENKTMKVANTDQVPTKAGEKGFGFVHILMIAGVVILMSMLLIYF